MKIINYTFMILFRSIFRRLKYLHNIERTADVTFIQNIE